MGTCSMAGSSQAWEQDSAFSAAWGLSDLALEGQASTLRTGWASPTCPPFLLPPSLHLHSCDTLCVSRCCPSFVPYHGRVGGRWAAFQGKGRGQDNCWAFALTPEHLCWAAPAHPFVPPPSVLMEALTSLHEHLGCWFCHRLSVPVPTLL